MKQRLTILCLTIAAPLFGRAADFNQAHVTHIIRDVKLLGGGAAARPAAVNDPVRQGDAVRTGDDSRAELTFADLTITRLGANTVFSFNEAKREVHLDSGALLLSVPRDGAAARINSAAATAAISGGTAMFETHKNLPTKYMVLEGMGQFCTTENPPDCIDVPPGEMVILGADGKLHKAKFHVGKTYSSAKLLTDFPELPNADLILQVIQLEEQNNPPSNPPNDPIDTLDQHNSAPPPNNNPPSSSGKFGPPSTINSPDPYVIDSSTVIQTDPTITTNGVTDQGKIFRGRTQDGSPSDFLFGNTTAFDTVVFGDDGSNQVYAVFKFAHLELAGDPTINVPNGGATNLALVSVGDLTSGMPGGTLTFSGMERVFFGTEAGSINLGSEISFADLFQLEFYARGAEAGLTIASAVNVDRLRLFSEGFIQVDGDEVANNFKAIAGSDFRTGAGNITATDISIQSLGDINIDSAKFPNPPGGGESFELDAADTLNLTIHGGGTFGWDSLSASAHTINLYGNDGVPSPGKLPPTTLFDFSNSSSVTFTAGTGGINASAIDFFGSNLTLESDGGISIGSATTPNDKIAEVGGSSFLSGSITAAESIFSQGNIETAILSSGGDTHVFFGSITARDISAGDPDDAKSFSSISAPYGITAIDGSITATGDIHVVSGSLSLESESGVFGNISAGDDISVSNGIFTPGDPCTVFAGGTIFAAAVVTGTLHGDGGITIDNSFASYSFGIIANSVITDGTLSMINVPAIEPNNRVASGGIGYTPVDFLLSATAIQSSGNAIPILRANGGDFSETDSNNPGNGGKITVQLFKDSLTIGELTAAATAPAGFLSDLSAIESNGGDFASKMSGGTNSAAGGPSGGNGGEIHITVPEDVNLLPFSHISATSGRIPFDGPSFAGIGGTVTIDAGGTIDIHGKIEVSSNEEIDQFPTRRSASGGNITLTSTRNSGVAVNISSSGQLLALLANATPGEGGTIMIKAEGDASSVNVAGEVKADSGLVDIRQTGGNGAINLAANTGEAANIRGDIVKVGALGANGVLTIGGGTISADNILRLYGGSSNGSVIFKANCEISGGNELSIAANTVRINDGVSVNVTGHVADVYTNHAQYIGGNEATTGAFTGLGANTHIGGTPPNFDSPPPPPVPRRH